MEREGRGVPDGGGHIQTFVLWSSRLGVDWEQNLSTTVKTPEVRKVLVSA